MTNSTLKLTLVFAFCASFSFGQTNGEVLVASEDSISEQLTRIGCLKENRIEQVKKLFLEVGAKETEIEYIGEKSKKSLVVTIPGNDEVIVVGAHFDSISKGCGVVDNWSGITIIANIYRSIRLFDTKKTIRFVAFGGEEAGLKGSRYFVDSLKKKGRKNVCAMLNFDSFGLAFPQVLSNTSDRNLMRIAAESAKGLKVPLSFASIRGVGSDADSFSKRGIPSISLHGLSADFRKIIHTAEDKYENIKPKSVYLGYRLGLKFLYEVERRECRVYEENEK